MSKKFALGLVVLLSGCANPMYLKHDSIASDSSEYFRDKTECGVFANIAAPVMYDRGQNKEVWNTTFYECMRGKGWYTVDANGNKIEYKFCSNPLGCF